jgi:hypothetical protein
MFKASCAILLLLIVAGCGGSNGNPTPTPTPTPSNNVVVSPASLTLGLNAHQTFTATLNGSPVAVTWSVSGGSGPGTIDANGNYTAPSSFPSPASPITVTVTAALQSNSATKGTAMVTVVYPNDNHLSQAGAIKLGTTGGNSTDLVNNGTTITCCSGTLGSLVTRGGSLFILSNNHVLDKSGTGAVGDPIGQPGLVDNNCSPGRVVANLTQAAPLKPSPCTGVCTGPSPSNVDAAIAAIVAGQVDTSGTILDLGPASSTSISDMPPSSTLAVPSAVLAANEGVAKSGRSSGLTCSNLQSVSTSVSVQYDSACGGATAFTATFANQVLVNGGSFSASGDSGSLIVTSDTARPVGLLYGGNSTSTSANPISDVLGAFQSGANSATIVGGADHSVSCAPTASASASLPGPSLAALSLEQQQRAIAVQERHASTLMQDPAIKSVTAGASKDSPGEAALLIHVSGTTRAPIPAVIDGVRTGIVSGAQQANGGVPLLNLRDIDESAAIKDAHASDLMSQSGIQGVGVGRSDDNPAETAIVIYVISGVAHPAIPATIDGVRTKIIEGDRFRAFGWGKEKAPATKCVKK